MLKSKLLTAGSFLLIALFLFPIPLQAALGEPRNGQQIFEYEAQSDLFCEDFLKHEVLTESRSKGRVMEFSYPYTITSREIYEEITYDYVLRSFKGTVTIKEDTKISKNICILVNQDCSLVIEDGVTLTVAGALQVEGTLENYGSLKILGEDGAQAGIFEEAALTFKPALVRNRGTFINNGSILLWDGTLENEGGLLENKSAIQITNYGSDSVGISNQNMGNATGTVINTGTVTVKNTDGKGIWNFSGAVFNNQGNVYKSDGGTVFGVISGEPVYRLEP